MAIDESSKLYQAYEIFKKNLALNIHPRYEEPDLIEIFDVAGDYSDIYVQSEILLLGARLFPESSELRQRRALFYSRISPDALHSFLETSAEETGLSWDILRLRDAGLTGKSAIDALEQIIARHSDLSDEDIIRLSELVRELGCTDWFLDNYDFILERAGYPETILYEVAAIAHETGKDEIAVTLLERLTEIDAFHTENWLLLVECYQSMGKFDDAFKALEYARAVADNDPEIDFVEASLLIDMGQNMPRVCSLLRKYLTIHPESNAAIHNLIIALNILGEQEEALKLLRNNIFKINSAPHDEDTLQFNPELIYEHTQQPFDSKNEVDEEYNFQKSTGIIEFLRNSLREGFPFEVTTFCRCNPSLLLNNEVLTYYLWALTFQQEYSAICAIYDSPTSLNAIENSQVLSFVFAFALLKNKRLKEASTIATKTIARLSALQTYDMSLRLGLLGIITALTSIIELAQHGSENEIENFDPLNFCSH